jgi:hypothetical protein
MNRQSRLARNWANSDSAQPNATLMNLLNQNTGAELTKILPLCDILHDPTQGKPHRA